MKAFEKLFSNVNIIKFPIIFILILLHQNLKVLVISQFFSTLPLSNTFNKNSHRIEFKWLSLTTFLAMSLIIFGTIEVFLAALSLKDVSLSLNNIGK